MPVESEVNRHPTVTVMVQSTTRSFVNTIRNSALKGPGSRSFSDLLDGDGLGLDGSWF